MAEKGLESRFICLQSPVFLRIKLDYKAIAIYCTDQTISEIGINHIWNWYLDLVLYVKYDIDKWVLSGNQQDGYKFRKATSHKKLLETGVHNLEKTQKGNALWRAVKEKQRAVLSHKWHKSTKFETMCQSLRRQIPVQHKILPKAKESNG